MTFIKAAVAETDRTGDMTPRARERVRSHQLVQPLMARIKGELNAFDSERAAEGQSKTTKLAKEVEKTLPKVKESPEIVKNEKDTEIQESEVKVPDVESKPVEKEDVKAETNDNRFSLDKFAALSKGLSNKTYTHCTGSGQNNGKIPLLD